MINSALYDAQKTLSGAGFQDQIFLLLAELPDYYGATASCDGVLTFPKENDSQPITINTAQGLVIGNPTEGGLRLNLNINCAKDESSQKELAVVLKTGINLVAGLSWDNFEFWAKLQDPQMQGTTAESMVQDLVLDYHNWDLELTAVVKDLTDDFNLRWGRVHDLKEHNLIKMVAGMFPNTLLSPFVTDEFILAGLSSITDV